MANASKGSCMTALSNRLLNNVRGIASSMAAICAPDKTYHFIAASHGLMIATISVIMNTPAS